MKEIVWTRLILVILIVITMNDQPAEKLEPTYNPMLFPHFISVETNLYELEVIPVVKPEPKPEATPKPTLKPVPKEKQEIYEITAYTVGDDFTPSHGVTASGEKVKAGRTIACPKSLAFGTEIYIPSLDHTYVCTDRGGRIKAGKLDIYMKSRKEALKFGIQDLPVVIRRNKILN